MCAMVKVLSKKLVCQSWCCGAVINVGDIFSPMAQQPLVGHGLYIIEASRSHSDTPHSVGLHWTSDKPDAETATWQHTALKRDIPMTLAGVEPVASGRWVRQSTYSIVEGDFTRRTTRVSAKVLCTWRKTFRNKIFRPGTADKTETHVFMWKTACNSYDVGDDWERPGWFNVSLLWWTFTAWGLFFRRKEKSN